jgi:hypothetical protein
MAEYGSTLLSHSRDHTGAYWRHKSEENAILAEKKANVLQFFRILSYRIIYERNLQLSSQSVVLLTKTLELIRIKRQKRETILLRLELLASERKKHEE